jgi:membrane protein required for colicin V production
MATMDLVFLAVLVFGAYRGVKKGIIMEVFSILALILAVIGAFKLLDFGIVWLTQSFGKPHPFIPFLSFILIFIGIILGINVLGRMTKGLVRMTLLGWVDKFFGAIIGLVKWTFGLSLILWILDSFVPDLSQKISEDSILFPIIMPVCVKVFTVLKTLFPFLEGLVRHISNYLK